MPAGSATDALRQAALIGADLKDLALPKDKAGRTVVNRVEVTNYLGPYTVTPIGTSQRRRRIAGRSLSGVPIVSLIRIPLAASRCDRQRGNPVVRLRNVSTTLIHPGSEFKLCFCTSIERLSAGQVYRLLALGLADRRLNRRRAWTRMALRNETQWKPAQETWREGRRRPSFPKTMPGRGKARAVSLTSM